MDSIKAVVANLMLDVEDYLNYVADYGKPNHKYFNFVLNKQGIMLIFLYKSNLLKSFVLANFIEKTLVELKNKFLKEKSAIKRAGLIFLLCKIFFTDDIAFGMKLRLTRDDWEVFKKYLNEIKNNQQYDDVRLMIFHLYTENFFRFTIKSKKLALDFGTPDNANEDTLDYMQSKSFWNDISDDLLKIENTDIVELKQLAELRDKALIPFDDLLPEKVSIDEALESFKAIKKCVDQLSVEKPKKASRKEVIQSCKEYMNQPSTSNNSAAMISRDVSESGTDVDATAESENDDGKSSKKKKKRKNAKSSNKKKASKGVADEDSGGSEHEFRELNKRRGFHTQKVFQGIGAFGSNTEKLKQVYE